jgi:hypothetical protein
MRRDKRLLKNISRRGKNEIRTSREVNKLLENVDIFKKGFVQHQQSSHVLGSLLIKILTAHPDSSPESEQWQKGQKELVQRSSNATQEVAGEGVGHHMQEDDPGFIANAIKFVEAEIKKLENF